MNIKFFQEVSKKDVSIVGGKGASLGEMTQVGLPVPPGFIITTSVFKKFHSSPLPHNLQQEILEAFDALKTSRVAVRSSATAEDSIKASWAGQLESYLNISRGGLIDYIKKCWDSIRSERVLAYAAYQGVDESGLEIAVVVQKMVESEVSGVMFTSNPITANKDEMMIEAGYGLGELLVQGLITPDNFLVDKHTYKVKSKDIQTQDMMLVYKDGLKKNYQSPMKKRVSLLCQIVR